MSSNAELMKSSGNFTVNDKKGKRLPITSKQFEVIFINKIQPNLTNFGKFTFDDLWVLINAYDYWQYENINKSTFG